MEIIREFFIIKIKFIQPSFGTDPEHFSAICRIFINNFDPIVTNAIGFTGIVGKNLQASDYRIVDINVGTSSQRPPVMYQARMSSMAMEAGDAVAVEGGESDVQVTVSGTIELQIP